MVRLLTQRTNRRPCVARALLGLGATAILSSMTMLLGAGDASAQTQPAPEIVEVKVIGSTSQVARITVRSPRSVSGIVRCDCAKVSIRVDLPTGGEKSVWLPFGNTDPYSYGQVVWDVPGAKDPEAPTGGQTLRNSAVAVLPSALGARTAPTSVSARGRVILDVVELTPDDIEQRAWLLDGFAVVATTSKELRSLSEDGRRSVFGWLERGGELLVDDADPVPDIAVQPTNDRNAFIGLGTVRRTANAIRTGQWESVMLPPIEQPWVGPTHDLGSLTLKNAVKLAPAGALLAGLLVYALGVGPLAYMLGLRRNQPMLMWVAVPLTAVVTTVGVLGIGFALRTTAKDQYVVFQLQGVHANRTTVARAIVEGGSNSRVRIPAGWSVRGQLVKLEVGTPSVASVDLPPGGLTEVRFIGDTAPSAQRLTATLDAARTLTVTSTGTALRNLFAVERTPNQSGGNQFNVMPLANVAAGGNTTAAVNTAPIYGGSDLDQERQVLAAFAAESGAFGPGSVVVVAEIDGNPAGIPSVLTKNARSLRTFVAAAAAPPALPRTADWVGGVVRIDIPQGMNSVGLSGTAPTDTIFVGSDEVPVFDGPVPAGAIQNGAIVLRSETAVVVETVAVVENASTEFVQ